MLNYNQIKKGKIIAYNNEPYKVMTNSIAKKNRNKPHNQTKIKSLISGKSLNITFHASDKAEEAIVERNELKYLYQKDLEVWFCVANDPKNRFFLDFEEIENQIKYLKQNDTVTGLYYDEELIGLDIPIKVELAVKEAPDAVRGNTSSGATKLITMENGLELQAPLFVGIGDIVVINTDTGEYSERRKG